MSTAAAGFKPCERCDAGWHGLIRRKIELEQRLLETRKNHESVMRLYSEWRSRAEKAEAELSLQP